jgi:hypothetical protein
MNETIFCFEVRHDPALPTWGAVLSLRPDGQWIINTGGELDLGWVPRMVRVAAAHG